MPHFRKKNSDKEMNSFMTASQTKAVTVGEISNNNVMKDDLGKGIVSEEIIKLFYIYGRAVLKLTGSKNEYKDIRKEKLSGEAMLHLFDELLAFQETFITPGNLLSDTTNLLDMGVLEYTEEELAEYVKQ